MAGETCNNAETASPGYSVLAPAQLGSCSLTGAYEVPAYTHCDSWRTSSVSLQWSIYVAGVSEGAAPDPAGWLAA